MNVIFSVRFGNVVYLSYVLFANNVWNNKTQSGLTLKEMIRPQKWKFAENVLTLKPAKI